MVKMLKIFLKKIPYLKSFFYKVMDLNMFIKNSLIQKRYKKVVNNKKIKISRGEKIRIAFFVTQKQLWCLQTVYDNFLLNNYLFEPVIVVFPNCEDTVTDKKNTCTENYIFFKNKKMSVIFGYDLVYDSFLKLKNIDADVIFYDQPSPGLPDNLLWGEASKNSLVCYVPYGYKVAKSYEAHFNQGLHNSCWVIFSESVWHKEQFKKFGKIKGKNVVVSGYPKLDIYNNKLSKLDKNFLIKFNHEQKIIIWAPHWSIQDSFIGYATFDKYYKFFLQYANAHKNIFWVFKPHQRLRYRLEEVAFMSKKDINEYYRQWDSLSNACFYNDSDYFELFKNSNALITDCGSFLAEYLPSKNPILLLNSDNSVGYNEVGEVLVESYYKAYNSNDIEEFVNNVVINGNDFLKEERLEKLNFVQPNPNGAGKFIVDYFKKILTNK